MKLRNHALAAALLLGAACARAPEEADVAVAQQAGAERPAVVAQANAAKPLIHVWKSPT